MFGTTLTHSPAIHSWMCSKL